MEAKTIFIEVEILYHELEPSIGMVIAHENLPQGTRYKPVRIRTANKERAIEDFMEKLLKLYDKQK